MTSITPRRPSASAPCRNFRSTPGRSKENPLQNPDFRDMLRAFSEADVYYFLVVAYTLASHGYVGATGDMDLCARPEPANAARVFELFVSLAHRQPESRSANLWSQTRSFR